jgi:hypothetical protein
MASVTEDTIVKQLSSIGSCGVFLYLYSEATDTGARVASRISETGRCAVYANARCQVTPVSAEQWFRKLVGFDNDETSPVALCFEKYSKKVPLHTSILIDEADFILNFQHCENLLLMLIHSSIESKTFNVLLCCHDLSNLTKIFDLNGGTKVKIVSKKNRDP